MPDPDLEDFNWEDEAFPDRDSDFEAGQAGADEEGGGGEGTSPDDPNRARRRRRRRRPKRPGQAGEATGTTRPQSGTPRPPGHHPRTPAAGTAQPRHRRGPTTGRPGQGRSTGRPGSRSDGRPPRDNRNHTPREPRANDGAAVATGPVVDAMGVLELHPKGYGFLRDAKNNYAAGKNDPFVPGSLIERHKLREGIQIQGEVIPGTKAQGPRLKTIQYIDGKTLEEYGQIRPFEELTAINPFEQIHLETGPTPITMRVMDLLTPIGKGQRALIVAPPRTGKTMLLQEIAHSVSTNHPEIHLIVLLIDERPEEVTEMTRRVRGEVIASSMDRDVESHVRISQLIIERGKRLAEAGRHVFILLDSITRTARAFNKWVGNTGRTMSGGLDVKALDIPKKMFGTARRFDEGGSLTVVGTALIETDSKMDEVIFQEFKGTGNMEMVLNRQLADRRIWPAIDITKSGTRREELILSPDTLEGVTMLRRSLITLNPIEAMEQLTKTLARFPSNKDFLAKVRSVL